MPHPWSNKEQLATDLRKRTYGRNAKERFSLAFNLSTFSTNYRFFSSPEVIQNRQLRCTLNEVRNWPKYERSIPVIRSNKSNTDLDKFASSYKARFPAALPAQNNPCHRTQGLDWYSSWLVISRRHHMIWSIASKQTKDHSFHWLVSL